MLRMSEGTTMASSIGERNEQPRTDTIGSFTREAKSRMDRFKKNAKYGARKRDATIYNKTTESIDHMVLPSKATTYFLNKSLPDHLGDADVDADDDEGIGSRRIRKPEFFLVFL